MYGVQTDSSLDWKEYVKLSLLRYPEPLGFNIFSAHVLSRPILDIAILFEHIEAIFFTRN